MMVALSRVTMAFCIVEVLFDKGMLFD
jgi:hypothetical protein